MAGLAAVGGFMQYQQTEAAAEAQAAQLKAQAKMAEQNARQESYRQEQIANKYAKEGEELKARQKIIAGQQRAQAGAAGLGMAGSPMDILSAGYDAYNEDKMTLLSNQRNDIYNSEVARRNYLTERNSYNTAASNTLSAAKAQGVGTILGTAASIYGMTGGFGSTGAKSTKATTSVSTPMSGNTTANFTTGKGYSFTPNKSLGQWGYGLNMGNFSSNNYFGYR